MTETSQRRRFRITLQGRLLAAMLVCVVLPIGITGGYLLRLNSDTLREKVGETLSKHLLLRETAFKDWTEDRARESVRWSASFIVYEGLETLGARSGERAAVRRDLDAYLESLMGHYRVYESLFIASPEGQVLSSTREESLEEWIRPAEILAAREGPVLSPIRVSARLGRPTQLVLQPVFSPRPERRGTALGLFGQRLDLRELESLLSAGAEPLSPALWVLDAGGHVLVRAGRVVDAPGTEPFPVRFAGDPPEGVVEAEVDGVASVVAARRLGGLLPGYLVACVPAEEAYRSIAESRWRVLGWTSAAIVAIFVLSFFAARSILKPILLLGEGARRVADGDLDVYLPVRGRDEIADLTRAFNAMAGRIRDGRASLEAAQRELETTNQGLRDANRTLETLAITDGLTSLYNHRHFQDTLEKELRHCEEAARPLSLLLIDIDHFKQFNDRWGHQEGDSALRRVAAQITKGIRSTDLAFRYGGEELAVLLPSCPKARAAEVAEKLRAGVRTNAQRPGRFGDPLTVSIGVATFPEDARVSRGLVDAADASLYAAKAAGRDRVVVTHVPAPGRTETAG